MKYLKLSKNLFLVEQAVPKKNQSAKAVPKNVNNIFIFDRSGSMCMMLGRLIKDLKDRLRTVQKGDTVTIGWFSSPGEYRFALKGLRITSDEDFKVLDKTLDSLNHTLGSTCFSEILADTKEVVEELASFGNTYSLCFLTDGYPTVYPAEKEEKSIFKAIEDVKGKISATLLVGYGNYYNKELMAAMAERFGGTLIHSSKLEDFPTAYQSFLANSRDAEPKVEVELNAPNGPVFMLGATGVNVFEVENGKVMFAPTKAKTDYIYTIASTYPAHADEVTVSEGDRTEGTLEERERFTKAVYAAAYVLTQRTKTDLALDALATIGDVAIIDRVNNAFTNAEYGAAEQGMLDAIGKPKLRFVAGRKANYLPKADAFSVLDALDMLMNDGEAEFWPYNDAFDYNRIGAATKTKEGYPEFVPDKNARTPFSNLTWNDTKLNLSVLTKIDGYIELPKLLQDAGLPKKYDTNIFRNYTIVKDGFLNVSVLPASMSKTTYERFVQEGIIDKEHPRHYSGRAYPVHLDRLPVMNRAAAEGRDSAEDLAKTTLFELAIEAKLKALNDKRKEIEPKRAIGAGLTPEQETLLQSVGVTRNGFAPPVDKQPTTDFYMAKEFEIKVKGFSSWPKTADVAEKIKAKKTLTPSQSYIEEGIKLVASLKLDKLKTDEAKLELLDVEITAQKGLLRTVRAEIQRTKFSVLLAKKWFKEFSSRENNKLTVGGHEVTIGVREVRIDL